MGIGFVGQYLLALSFVVALAVIGVAIGIAVAKRLVRSVSVSAWSSVVAIAVCFVSLFLGVAMFATAATSDSGAAPKGLLGIVGVLTITGTIAALITWFVIGRRHAIVSSSNSHMENESSAANSAQA